MNPINSSTPVRSSKHRSYSTNCSSISLSTLCDERNDPDFQLSGVTTQSSSNITSNNEPESFLTERKFVVYESNLDCLLNRMICPSCKLPTKVEINKRTMGTSVHVKMKCHCGNDIDWKAQPIIGQMPAFNLIYSASTFFSGNLHSQLGTTSFPGLLFSLNSFYLKSEISDFK